MREAMPKGVSPDGRPITFTERKDGKSRSYHGKASYYVIKRLSTGEYYAGRIAPARFRGGRAVHTFTKSKAEAIRYRQHPLRVVMPKLLRIFWRDLQALNAETLLPFEGWRLKKSGNLPQAPPPFPAWE